MSARKETVRSKESRRFGYGVAVVFNLIVLFVFHNLVNWGVPFVTAEFEDVLWALDLSIGVTVASNLLFMIYDPSWFRSLLQLVQGAFAFIAVLTLYRVFPFDFGSDVINQVVRIALAFAMVGIIIAAIVDLVRLFMGRGDGRAS